MAKVEDRISLADARAMAGEIGVKLGFKTVLPEKIGPDTTFIKNVMIPSGSIRQEKPTIGDIDLVCTGDIDEFDVERLPGVEEVWSRGEKQIFFNYVAENGLWRPVNIFVLEDPDAFGGFMMHTTGSNVFNIVTRKKAKKRGMLLNQYGLFDRVTNEQVAGATEGSVFKALDMEWVPPNGRV